MSQHSLQQPIEDLWERRDSLSSSTKGAAREAVEAALDALDRGEVRVAEKTDADWQVNQWLKKAVLLSFRLTDSVPMACVKALSILIASTERSLRYERLE